MAERHTTETYGPQPNNRNIWQTGWRHAWPILLSVLVSPFYTLLLAPCMQGVHSIVHCEALDSLPPALPLYPHDTLLQPQPFTPPPLSPPATLPPPFLLRHNVCLLFLLQLAPLLFGRWPQRIFSGC